MDAAMDELFRGVHMSLKPFRYSEDVTTEEVFERASKVLIHAGDRKLSKGENLASMLQTYREQMDAVDEQKGKHDRGRTSLLEPMSSFGSRLERSDSMNSVLSNFSDMSSMTFAP